MSSPQKSDFKENNLDKKFLENCLINQNLNKIFKNKSFQKTVSEKENFIKKNIKINTSIMLQQQQQGQQQTLFENMIKHCGLVEELGMYSEDQYDGQQLDSSSASSKTEEMPVSEISQNPVSPRSESGSIGVNSVNNEVQLNLSQNSSVGSGRASVNSNASGNTNKTLIKSENQLQNDLIKNQNNTPLTPTTVGNLNVNSLLNSVSVANALNNINSSNNNVNAATAAAAAAVAAQQQLSVAAASNNSSLLSELSALVAANNNSNNQNDLTNSSSKNNGNNINSNSLASLNGLGLLNNLGNLTNSLPINQLASLLAGNNANAAANQQHQMLLQANNLAKLSGFNINTNEIHDHLQQLQQLQQNLQQILLLNQLNQQQQPNLSALNTIAPLGQMLSSLPQNLQSLLQNSNLLGSQNLLNSPLNQQSPQQNNRPGSAGSSNNLNIPQFLQQLQDATSQVLQQTNNSSNQNQANILNGSNLLSSLSSNCGQNVSNLLKNPLHNENLNNKSSLLKNKDIQRSSLNSLSSKINDSSINLQNLSQHLLSKNSQIMNGSSNNFNNHQNNNNTVAAALANHLQNSSMDCESSNVFDKLQNNSNKSNCNINNNNTVANALLQQHQKQQISIQSNSQNSNNLIINVQQQIRQLSQNQQLGNFIPNVKQLSPQFENNSNHSNFSNSSSTNSKLNQQSSNNLNNELSSGNMNLLNNLSNAQANGNEQEVKNLEELEQFAKYFKQRRIKMGYTQGDVGLAMGKRYANEFSQTTISRFEALNLSYKNMLKLRPMLERWLHDTEANAASSNGGSLNINNPIANGQMMNNNPLSNNQALTQNNCVSNLMSSGIESMCKRRKKRTSIETQTRQELEKAFDLNQKPTFEEISILADKLNMEKEVVRVWFCNRRQKQRKTNFNGDCAMLASLNEFGQLRQLGSPIMSDDGISDQQYQKMANRYELVRSGLNLALSSPSSPSTPQQFTVVSPGSPDSPMNVDHSLPSSPVSSRKYSIRQGSFS